MTDDYSNIANYEFKNTLGEGNFAKVKLSIFKPTNETFAIKIINKKKLKQKMKNTIFRENEIIAKLNHPNIIKIYNVLEDEQNFYIIMEYCVRGELFDYIVKKQNLTEHEAAIFFYQLINGVEYIHSQNIAHRDLKPENLLLTEDKILKIIDFGLSHPFNGEEYLKTKCGSPSYAAPEIINGKEYDGFKTDIWCCGVILYAMLCGYLPFEGENDKELFKNIVECDPDIPKELSRESKKLIRKIFTPNPNRRITIKEIKESEFYLKGKDYYNTKYKNKDSLIREIRNQFFKEESIVEDKSSNNNNYITIEEDNHFTDSKDENSMNKIINDEYKYNNKEIHNLEDKILANKERINTYGNIDKTEIPKLKLQLNNIAKNNYIFKLFQRNSINDELKKLQKKKFENFQKIIRTESNEYKNKLNPININSSNFLKYANLKDNQTNKIMPIINLRDNIFHNDKKNIIAKVTEGNKFQNIINNYKSKKLYWSKSPKLIQYVLDDNNTNKNKIVSSNKLLFYNNHLLSTGKKPPNKIEDKNYERQFNTINSKKVYLNGGDSSEGQNSLNANSKTKESDRKIKRRGKMSNPGSLKNKLINIVSKNIPSNLYYNNIHININTINVNDNRYHNLDEKKFFIEREKFLKLKEKNENGYYINKTDIGYQNRNNPKLSLNKLVDAKNNNLGRKIAISLGPHHKMKEGGLLIVRTGNLKKNYGNYNLSKNIIRRRGNPKSEENYKIKKAY